jgi:hypothetical protein
LNIILEKVEVNSINGIYRIYQYNDGNPLPKLKICKVTNDVDVPVKNTYGELKRLNDEFSFKIDYEPKNRTKLNTREFGKIFIIRFKAKFFGK